MEKHSHRILSKHFAFTKNKLISFADHFDIANHGDLKGYGREALVGEFLQTHLPDQVEFLTGEIIDTEDNRSGQIDIIIQSKSAPKIPLWGNIHLSYSDAVIAAVEVKSNLTTQHLRMTLESCTTVKSLKRNIVLTDGNAKYALTQIPYIVFAYTGLGYETVISHFNKFAAESKLPLASCTPDMVVVLDKDYYICRNNGWQFPIVQPISAFFRHWDGVADENLVGLYNYINNLILAYNSELRPIATARYFLKSIGKK